MKKKQIETLLYSVAGVGAMLVIVLVVNFIIGAFKQRIDLTHEKLYTLSQGTRNILKNLDPKDKLEIRFYVTQGEKEMDNRLKSYAQHVEDLLAEYKKAAGGKIKIKKLNPKPDSDAEDSAHLDGIEGQPTPTGDVMYFGLAIDYLGDKVALPSLPPDRERLLEYDISRVISKVTNPQKAIVGVMTPLPMFGMPGNPMMARMGQQPQEPWVVITELQQSFTVRQVPMTADKIDDDIKVLMVVHPKEITDAAQYAIDQFIMRGGKLIAFLDGLSITDRSSQPQNGMMPPMGSGSSLEKLLKAWGITFDTTKVAADRNFKTPAPPRGETFYYPVLSIKPQGINKDDVATAQIDSLLVPFTGVFTGTPSKELKETVLVKTTTDSELVESFLAQMGGDQVAKDFKASGTVYPIAIRLTGKFKTAFPEGKPKDTEKSDEKKDDAKKDEKKPDDSLKECKSETAVVLIGDADMLHDQFCVTIQNFFGQRFATPRNGNLNLAQNLVEQMAGDENLIAVRSRATLNRPFEKIDQMQAKAEDAFRAKRKELEDGLRETQQKLSELQAAKKEKGQQSLILSNEQQEEIKKFREKEARAKIELRDVKKKLKRETESLENDLKWVNIAGMPLLVTAFGLGLAFFKGQRAKKR